MSEIHRNKSRSQVVRRIDFVEGDSCSRASSVASTSSSTDVAYFDAPQLTQSETALSRSNVLPSSVRVSASADVTLKRPPQMIRGRSSNKSLPVKAEKNFTFSQRDLQQIERNNQILLNKILHTKVTTDTGRQSSKSTISNASQSLSVAALNHRRKQQAQIDYCNDILQKKLQKIANRKLSQ